MASSLHGHAESVLAAHRWRTADDSAAYLLPRLRPGLDLLDVGCGPGSLTADLAARVAPGRTVGVDSAAAVLDEARTAAPGVTSGRRRVSARPAGRQRRRRPRPPGAAARGRPARGAARDGPGHAPGGLVAVRDADDAAMSWAPASPGLDRWRALDRATARGTGGEPDAAPRLLGWAQQAGLTDVVCSASTWCFTGADRRWWGGLWAERAVASTSAAQAVAQGHATREELEEVSAAFRTWAEQEDGWWAVLHGEVLARVP